MQNPTVRFAQIFWGLILVVVDFHAGRFDVVPDFVGYGLIALGAGGLLSVSSQFNLARLLSWFLVPVTLVLLLIPSLTRWTWLLRVPADAALMWFLLGGLAEFAAGKQRSDLASRGSTFRLAYVGLAVVGVLLGWLSAILPNVARILTTISLVASLIVAVVILHLIYLTKGLASTPVETVSAVPPAPVTPPAAPEDVKKAA